MNKSFLSILITATVLFSACRDELEQNSSRIPIVEGDEVNFGAYDLVTYGNGHSDFSRSANSRTSYENAYHDEKGWHYPLNWVFGDQIKVYCPQAADAVARDYRIEWEGGTEGAISPDDNKTAYMVKVGENGLHWGDLSKPHTFHAFYPASAINNDENFKNGVVHAHIPSTQEMIKWEPEEIEVNGQKQTALVGKPNMNYAFMSAHTTIEDPRNADNRVTFDFKPLTTAVEITLQGASSITGGSAPLTAVQISSENKGETEKQAVCGDFEHDILNNKTTVHNDNVATDYMITVPLWQKEGDDLVPLELGPGQIVRFTVFLLPGEDSNGQRTLKNLQVRVPGWNTGVRVKYYDNINLEVGTKSQIWLPDYDTNDKPNTWLGSLPDNVYISQLSIPGSVNAFSDSIFSNYSYPGVGRAEMDLTQALSVKEQFNFGVRAFEIATERYVPGWGEDGNNYNLGESGKIIAGTTTGINVGDAIKELAQLVFDNPSEFVIVMPYYAPHATSDTEMWTKQLRKYLQDLGGSIPVNGGSVPVKAFENSMTIGDARGSVLFLSRISGDKNECENIWGLKPQYTTAIYGWGSDKDRWTKRGYGATWNGDGNPKDNGYNYNNKSIDNWKYDATIGSNAEHPGAVNFYIQDWLRVCENDGTYLNQSHPLRGTYWYKSIDEKIYNITDFMDNTIGNLKFTTQADAVFINSLSGYYIISKSDGTSGQPEGSWIQPDAAKHGDIPPFAAAVNKATYDYILDLDYNKRGPLGIVLINYAGVETYATLSMHGDYIVKALVDNNFRFPLLGSSGK